MNIGKLCRRLYWRAASRRRRRCVRLVWLKAVRHA